MIDDLKGGRGAGLAPLERRRLIAGVASVSLLPRLASAQATPSLPPINELGPEAQRLAQRAGFWDVTETVWERPDAAPVVTRGLVAERRMIGAMLQEFLRPVPGDPGQPVERVDYLRFNRVEGRWDYVSMDTRVAVGIMPAWSVTRGEDAQIVLQFQPFALPGPGPGVSGQMLRMEQVVTFEAPDQDVKDQYFILADGTATRWLAHRYAYVRRS